uniref:SUEL-type lectin domain-containing protein n=1 Tax=Oncorhynchus kisutch TaxID=8019 RepID=A0A8C7CKG0_ONCKI
MLDECQDRRICQVLVNSRLFGMDPCPSSSKYLIVWYKCMPNEYKSTVVCEEERMKLSCKQGMQIAVYSAMFGRTQQGTLECPTHHRAPSVVPKNLLQQVPSPRVPVFYPPPPGTHDPNVVGDSAPPDETSGITSDTVLSVIPSGKKKRGRESGSYSGEVKTNEEGVEESAPQPPDMNPVINSTTGSTNMALISSTLAAYNYIADHPERAALYFLCGVCLGLFFTLFALVVQISCRTDCQPRRRPSTTTKKRPRPSDSSSDSRDSDSDTTSDLSARRHRRFERTLNMNVFTSAEELERAQRLEERERIIREIWMNGQPDIPGTRSLNRYY